MLFLVNLKHPIETDRISETAKFNKAYLFKENYLNKNIKLLLKR